MIDTSWDTSEPDIEPFRLGFIGAGAMASFAVYPALHFAPIRLLAVCDLQEYRRRRRALGVHDVVHVGRVCVPGYQGKDDNDDHQFDERHATLLVPCLFKVHR